MTPLTAYYIFIAVLVNLAVIEPETGATLKLIIPEFCSNV
jgi:hypothetical protein